MHRLRALVMATGVTAFAITALGAPASADVNKGTIAVVNGMPGVKVDICIKTRFHPGKIKEIKSGVPYGGKAFKRMIAGSKVIKVFKKDPRTCRGVKLAQKFFTLAEGADLTLVATKKSPKKIVIFDNAGLGVLPTAIDSVVVIRHAADLGGVTFRIRVYEPDAERPITPTASDPIWEKGDQIAEGIESGPIVKIRVTRPDKTRTIAGPVIFELEASRRHEWMLLGTKVRNARFVQIKREVEVTVTP